jgi:two-component system sensor histidine kinase/response regulator
VPSTFPESAAARDGLPLSIRLLVIDDDDVDRERVLRLLARTPMAVEAKQADSGATALQLLRQHDFDCIMLDNQLGDDNGTELLPSIQRELRRPCPVIMITGAGNESLAVRALQHGAADYLTKYQLNTEALVRAIRRALEHQRMRDELDELHQRMEQRVEEQAAAIRQSERDLRAILDHTPTVISYWSADLHNRFGNRALQRWLGVDPQTLPGRHLRDVIGADRLARDQHHIDGVLRGESQFFEQTDLGPDGNTRRHAQVSLHPDVDDDGRVRGFYSTLNDVTEIKLAQARAEELAAFAHALFEHSPVGLGVFDAQLCCLQGNRELAQLLGTGEHQLPGLLLPRLSADEMLQLTATARATLADGHPRHLQVDVQTVFGRRLQAACAWARVERDRQGQLLLAVQDSSEQRRAHDELVQARNAAEEATRSKSRFLANMSHEIRTPMNAIIGLTRLVLDDGLPAQARDFIDKAHTAAMALMGLLDDVLDYSKIEAGQLRLEQVPLHIGRVLQRVLDLFAARAQQKGLVLQLDIAQGVPPWVRGDPLRLGQVLNNLVGNALKFTEHGQVTVSVRPADPAAPTPGMLHFAVRDSGIGIAAEQHEALFEAFSQADDSITRRFGGTGLGLSICRRLVTQMHGSIGVLSAPGQGSEFWFTARLEPVPAPDEEPADATAPPDEGALPLQGLSVLLVEDNAINQLVAQVTLERLGARVTRADDGQQALRQLHGPAAPQFDAVLMDVHMPNLDGLQATRRIRDEPRTLRLPVIGMTASALPEDRLQCLQAGMDDYLTKPIVVDALLQALQRWTGRQLQPPVPTEGGAADALPAFDLPRLTALMRGNAQAVQRLLRKFAAQEAGTLANIGALLERGDRLQAAQHLHRLRGGAATLGANRLAQAALQAEQALRLGGPADVELAALAAALREALAAIHSSGG